MPPATSAGQTGAVKFRVDRLAATSTSKPRPTKLPKKAKKQAGLPLFVRGWDGRRHRYLNAAIPIDRRTLQPIAKEETCVCAVGIPGKHTGRASGGGCGHGYASLMGSGRSTCDECRWDAAVEWGMTLQQDLGVELGWTSDHPFHRSQRLSRADRAGLHLVRQREA